MWLNRHKKGITLIELLIATVVFAVIISAAMVGMRFMSRLRVDKEAYEPAIAGARALEYFFTRVLRADDAQIMDAGRSLKFRVVEETGATRWAKFSKGLDDTLLYDYNINDSEGPEIVVKGIKDVVFIKDYQDRISVELEISTEDMFHAMLKSLPGLAEKEAFAVDVNPPTLKLRTSVQPRNIATPKGVIN